MILRPDQIKLLRQGMPCIPANGGGGESNSSANQTSTTVNTDKRIATQNGVIATEGSTLNYNVQTLDPDIVAKALDTVQVGSATNGDGFGKLLNLADHLISGTQDSATQIANTASGMAARYQSDVLDAYSRSTADKSGGIDQKTMIVLGVAGAVALVAMKRK